MRNIPFAFLNEDTIDQINQADREYVNGLAKLAETQQSMRGLITWSTKDKSFASVLKSGAMRLLAALERMMEMSGPNSIANLERALRARDAQGGRIAN